EFALGRARSEDQGLTYGSSKRQSGNRDGEG
ncbi:unnamed protein product, partial [marine sediment metagenome]